MKTAYQKKRELRFGAKVKKLRLAKGLTQGQLADISNVSINEIGRIEGAGVDVRLKTMFALANALEVECGELV